MTNDQPIRVDSPLPIHPPRSHVIETGRTVPFSVRTLTFKRWGGYMTGLILLGILSLIGCLRFGTEPISLSQLLNLFVGGVFGSGDEMVRDPTSIILFQIRLPRVLLAFLVGGSLAAVGVVLQALLRNPLADPFVIGVSSGAALGAAIALLFGVGISLFTLSALPLCAFLGALGSLALIYRIGLRYARFSIHTILLAGVVLNAIFSAFIMFLTSIAEPTRAFGMFTWMMGTLTGPDFSTLGMLMGFLGIGLLVMGSQSHSLNLLTLGEESAQSLGVEVTRVKKMMFVSSALVTGAVVAFSGLIGFVGLIVPHAVRLVFGADHRLLFPASAILGGIFLMVADTLARTVLSPVEMPVGVVTALVGGPIFLWLLIRQRSRFV